MSIRPTWDDVVRDHSARVYRHAYRLTGNRQDAEDLAQDVFVRVFRSLDTFQPGSLEGWLHRITTNLFLDRMRRHSRVRFDAFAPGAEERLASTAPTPEDASADTGFDADVEGIRTSLANLLEPIDEYHEVFDPYGDREVVDMRLSDDIADVVTDLVHGLQHYRAGRSLEALWWWQFSYLSNWGSTASSVLRALHSVVSHVRLDTPVDDATVVEDRLLAETAADAVVKP